MELAMHDGLAVYTAGAGDPVLLMPYPHGYTLSSTADGALARLLRRPGRRLITFDPPGAYRTTRHARLTPDEMVDTALEVLGCCREQRVTVVGHSMGGLCSLILALEHPEWVRRLVLVGAVSGGVAAMRYGGMPRSLPKTEPDFWRFIWWGMRLGRGGGNLAIHKQMLQLIQRRSHFDPSRAPAIAVEPGDERCPAPVRDRWPMVARRMDFSRLLGRIKAPTLVCVGRHDPQAPVACSEELANGIPGARLEIFEQSGHYPFAEEPERFDAILSEFMAATAVRDLGTGPVAQIAP